MGVACSSAASGRPSNADRRLASRLRARLRRSERLAGPEQLDRPVGLSSHADDAGVREAQGARLREAPHHRLRAARTPGTRWSRVSDRVRGPACARRRTPRADRRNGRPGRAPRKSSGCALPASPRETSRTIALRARPWSISNNAYRWCATGRSGLSSSARLEARFGAGEILSPVLVGLADQVVTPAETRPRRSEPRILFDRPNVELPRHPQIRRARDPLGPDALVAAQEELVGRRARRHVALQPSLLAGGQGQRQ